MAAITNGTLTPPSIPPAPASPALAKRKRAETDPAAPNGTLPTQVPDGPPYSLPAAIRDVVTLLKSYDTEPSILAHPLASSSTRNTLGEADTKRTKLSSPKGSSIQSLVQSGAYDSWDSFRRDVDSATDDILTRAALNDDTTPLPCDGYLLQSRIAAFEKMAKSLITREEVRLSYANSAKGGLQGTQEKDQQKQEAPSVKMEEGVLPESRAVLTLYGSAQGPKQLFSSLQETQAVGSIKEMPDMDTSVQVTLPLREATLPNFISTTDVFPLADEVDEKKKIRATIGKVFKAPAHLQQLSPPKIAKPLTTKGNTVTFAPAESPKPPRKGSQSFTNQNLSAGFWLGYGGVDMPKDSTSPTAKQKSRQRALSTGAAQQPPSEVTLTAVKHAKEDALFRSAYSSFAPTRDNASAVVPEEIKSMVWWQKVGEKRFNDVFPVDPELLASGEPSEELAQTDAEEDSVFKQLADAFEPLEESQLFGRNGQSNLEKDTDEVLHEISELLETLASHQRIRNSSLATNPRTPVIQNSSLAILAGSPATPSTEEVDVYQMLKMQLSLMVSQLPPYAVAKLNGDQLEELNISRIMLIENKNARGILEEDQSSRVLKAQSVAPPNLSRMTSSGSGSHFSAANTQYGRPTSSVHSSARPLQSSSSYFSQQQGAHRSPSVQHPRASSGYTQGYHAPSTVHASTPRQSYSSSQSYSQQTPRAQYGQSTPSQYYSSHRSTQPSNYGGAAASQYHGSAAQTQSHGRYPHQSTNGHFQRSTNVALMYGSSPSAHGRTASPLKAGPVAGQSNYTRSAYTPATSSYFGPSQYANTQLQTPVSGTPTSGLGTNPQQMMLDRQQAQAAAQPQARLAAQNSFTRQGSGTPQPPTNGQTQGTSVAT